MKMKARMKNCGGEKRQPERGYISGQKIGAFKADRKAANGRVYRISAHPSSHHTADTHIQGVAPTSSRQRAEEKHIKSDAKNSCMDTGRCRR